MSDVHVRFGAALRDHRTRHRLTQEELAERSGLSYKFIGELERGRGNPTLETIAKLARALGMGLGELAGGADRVRASDEYRVAKRDVQAVREAAASLDALVEHLTSPPYRTKPRGKTRRSR